MKMKKLNESLGRVRVGEDDRVPIESNRKLWFLWIAKNGDWDAEVITRKEFIMEKISKPEVINVFCNWHGLHRTDLFLMDKNKLINRLKKILKK